MKPKKTHIFINHIKPSFFTSVISNEEFISIKIIIIRVCRRFLAHFCISSLHFPILYVSWSESTNISDKDVHNFAIKKGIFLRRHFFSYYNNGLAYHIYWEWWQVNSFFLHHSKSAWARVTPSILRGGFHTMVPKVLITKHRYFRNAKK